ncbi:MAG: tetratricopeptide repeat protein [Henriciella sp.]
MGIVQWLMKAALAAFFVFAAVFTYSVGEQRGATDTAAPASLSIMAPLKTDEIKTGLTSRVQNDLMGDFDQDLAALSERAPLDVLPFEIELARALTRNDAEAANAFADQALRRQPRSLAARLFGLSRAAQTGDYDRVIADYERIIELRAIDRNVLSDAIVGVFRGSGDWSALIEYLKSQPTTGRAILQRLMDEPMAVEDLESVIALYPEQQSRYLDRLVRDGATAQAYSAWQRFTGFSDDALNSLPFNQQFEDLPAPPPFNWMISRERAEFQSRGGLYVTYLGTERPLMARQIISASPGDYLLSTEALGRMPEEGGALEWTLHCLEDNSRLATSQIELKTIGEQEIFETTLTIPGENCDFQRLDLWGRSGAFPKTSRTEILSVSLDKFGE